MTTLTEAERDTLYSPIGNDEAYPELPGVVADIIAGRISRALKIVAEFEGGGDLTSDRADAIRAALASSAPATESGQA